MRTSAPGAVAASRRRTRRACRTILLAIDSNRSRSRFGSHRRAGTSVNASICIHAVSSHARCTSANQSRFWSKSCSRRFCSPVTFADRIRSSHRAPRRCRNSRSGSCPRPVLAGERGQPQPVTVGEPQLRPRMRTLFPHDHAHAVRPRRQVEQPSDLGDPGRDAQRRCLRRQDRVDRRPLRRRCSSVQRRMWARHATLQPTPVREGRDGQECVRSGCRRSGPPGVVSDTGSR